MGKFHNYLKEHSVDLKDTEKVNKALAADPFFNEIEINVDGKAVRKKARIVKISLKKE